MCTMEARMCPDGSMMPRAKDCTWLSDQCNKAVTKPPQSTTTAESGLACNPKDDKWKRGAGGGSDGRPIQMWMCPIPSQVSPPLARPRLAACVHATLAQHSACKVPTALLWLVLALT